MSQRSSLRVAVISDVCVERSGGGSLLLERIFSDPIFAGSHSVYHPAFASTDQRVRVPHFSYTELPYTIPRLIRNRFNPFWPALMSKWMKLYSSRIIQAIAPSKPELIVTVPHWYLWFAAADVARKLSLPLAFIVHDDWPSYQTFRRPGRIWDAVRKVCRQMLGQVYRQAAARLCVSPGMESYCRSHFGVRGEILYPSRGQDSPVPEVRITRREPHPPVVAYCGLIHQDGTTALLREVANILSRHGGHLDLYTIYTPEQMQKSGLLPPTVRVQGYFPSHEMGRRVAATADLLFLPASFEHREKDDVSTLFPSKLADYTAIGLPVLAWGPSYSSASQWGLANPGAMELVTEFRPERIEESILRLSSNFEHASQVASNGIEAGKRYFELSVARRTVIEALQRAKQARRVRDESAA